jgi:hypothetical protein
MRAKPLRKFLGCNNGLYHTEAIQVGLRPLLDKAHGA